MQVTLRFTRGTAAERADVIDRLIGCVLLQAELPSVRYVNDGFYFDTERSRMQIIEDLEYEGFEYTYALGIASITFEH